MINHRLTSHGWFISLFYTYEWNIQHMIVKFYQSLVTIMVDIPFVTMVITPMIMVKLTVYGIVLPTLLTILNHERNIQP